MSTYTGQTFQLHTTRLEQAQAQAECNQRGGHLASFSMLEEQNQVEEAYKTMVSRAALFCLCVPALSVWPHCCQGEQSCTDVELARMNCALRAGWVAF